MDRAIEWIDGRIVRMEIAVDITERKQSEDILRRITNIVSARTGSDFFQSLATFLGQELHVDYTLVGRLKERTTEIETLAVYAHGKIVENIVYSLEHTPCYHVVGKEACFYPRNIQELFPEDRLLEEMGARSYAGIPLSSSEGRPLGLIVIVDRKEMKDADRDRVLTLMQLLSTRASAEMERQIAEDALRESTDKFSKAFHSSPTFITISTQDRGVYIDVNDAFIHASGYRREELIGRSSLDLGIWADLEDRARIVREIEKSGSVSSEEVLMRMKNGQLRTVLYSTEAIMIQKEPCLISVGLDITDRKHLEEQLRQSQKMEAVGQLAGGVAHDFNNILTAIISNSYLLQSRTHDDEISMELTGKIIALSDNAAKIVQELLMFSRKQKVKTTLVHLNDIVRDALKLLEDFVGENVAINSELSADQGLSILADRNQIEQVIINLATNARDAMPEGGTITIKTDLVEIDEEFIDLQGFGKPGIYAVLSVSDTGTGMGEEVRKKIFEPFFTTKEVGKGTGLGLSIVYGIVKQHKGFIRVYSAEGKGSTFVLYFHRAEVLSSESRRERLSREYGKR
jgi:PAS domain S-box-containing protein